LNSWSLLPFIEEKYLSESILKDAVSVLSEAYPNVEKSTFMAACKCQFKWALTEKGSRGGLCKEAAQTMVFMRETEVFIEQMEGIGEKARSQYKASVQAIQEQEKV
jgi:hypothetical protein